MQFGAGPTSTLESEPAILARPSNHGFARHLNKDHVLRLTVVPLADGSPDRVTMTECLTARQHTARSDGSCASRGRSQKTGQTQR